MWALAIRRLAATSTGTLTVTGTVASSINLTIEAAGGSTSGLSTGAATSALSSISKYGTVPTGFSITRTGSDWKLASSISVKVDKANLTVRADGQPFTRFTALGPRTIEITSTIDAHQFEIVTGYRGDAARAAAEQPAQPRTAAAAASLLASTDDGLDC